MYQNRRFLRLWSAHAVSTLGDEVYLMAVPLIVLQIGGSASVMALVYACSLLPHVVFGVVGGAYADRGDRFRVLRGSYLASCAILLVALGAFALFGAGVQLSTLAVTAFSLAAVAAFSTASVDSLIPDCVAPDQLARANSSTEAVRTVATVAGPAAAGFLVGYSSSEAAIAVNCLSFIAAYGIIRRLNALARARGKGGPAERTIWADVREGARYLLRSRRLFVGVTMSTVTNLVFGAYESILIFYLSKRIGLSPSGVGIVFSIGGCTSVVTAALLSWRAPSRRYVPVMTASIALQGVGVTIVAAVPTLIAAVAGQILVAAAVVSYTVYWRAFRQSISEPKMLGRVSGACRAIAYAGAFIGTLLSGGLLTLVSEVTVLLWCSGVITCGVGVAGFLLLARRKVTPQHSLTADS